MTGKDFLYMGNKTVEEALAPIVYSQLQDQLPELFKYLIGFQLLDERNDGVRSLGLAAFNIKGKHYYIPIFYLNGYLKPIILLYNYEKAMFMPAIGKVIDMLLKPGPGLDVKPVETNHFDRIISTPSMNLPLSLGKTASINFEKVAKENLTPDFLELLTKNKDLLRKFSEYHPNFIKSDIVVPDLDNGSVTIYRKISAELTDKENKKIENGKIVIKDTRKDHAIPLQVEDNVEYHPPMESGKYKLLDKTGKMVKMWVIVHGPVSILVDPETMEYTKLCTKNLIGVMIEPNLDNLVRKSVPRDQMKMGKRYFLLSFCGGTTEDFTFTDKVGEYFTINPHTEDEITKLEDGSYIISSNVRAIPLEKCSSFYPGEYRQLKKLITTQEFVIDKEASFNQNLEKLVVQDGLSEKDAIQVLTKRGTWYKLASKIVEDPYIQEYRNLDMGPGVREKRTPDPVFSTPKNDINFAMRAAASGNQNVFDAALLGILAKSQNDIERIKSILPVIHQVTHSLGVILFMLWWNPGIYSKDFSPDNLYELEQSILSTFKELGSISVDLTTARNLQGDSYG